MRLIPGRGGRSELEFDQFVRDSSTRLFRSAVAMTGERSSAEDLLQEALLRTARRWSVACAAPYPYARAVLVNLAKDRWRARSRRPLLFVDDMGLMDGAAEPPDGRTEQRDELMNLLAALPARQQVVLVLRYFDDLSVADAAAVLGCNEAAVRSLTHRAISRLRELLAANGSSEQETARC